MSSAHGAAAEPPPEAAAAFTTVPMLLSIPRVAGILGRSTRTVHRRIAAGELPAVIDHGRTMVRGDDLRDYIDRLEAVGAPGPQRRTRPRRNPYPRIV